MNNNLFTILINPFSHFLKKPYMSVIRVINHNRISMATYAITLESIIRNTKLMALDVWIDEFHSLASK